MKTEKEFAQEMVTRHQNLLNAQPENAVIHKKNLKIWQDKVEGTGTPKVREEAVKEWYDGTKKEIAYHAVVEGVLLEEDVVQTLKDFNKDPLIEYVQALLDARAQKEADEEESDSQNDSQMMGIKLLDENSEIPSTEESVKEKEVDETIDEKEVDEKEVDEKEVDEKPSQE